MALIEFKNKGEAGYEDTPMNAENINNNFKEVDKKYSVTVLASKINTKGEHTLSDSVFNYDEIRIWATKNTYDHRQMCNIYKYVLDNAYVHFLQYMPNDFDDSLKFNGNKIDTSQCTNFGVDNRHIYCVEGIKYSS